MTEFSFHLSLSLIISSNGVHGKQFRTVAYKVGKVQQFPSIFSHFDLIFTPRSLRLADMYNELYHLCKDLGYCLSIALIQVGQWRKKEVDTQTPLDISYSNIHTCFYKKMLILKILEFIIYEFENVKYHERCVVKVNKLTVNLGMSLDRL